MHSTAGACRYAPGREEKLIEAVNLPCRDIGLKNIPKAPLILDDSNEKLSWKLIGALFIDEKRYSPISTLLDQRNIL